MPAGSILRASDTPGNVGCRLRRTAAQAFASGVLDNVDWDQEDQDTDGFITVTSDTIIIPTGLGGLYAITLNVNFSAAVSGRSFLRLGVTSSVVGVPTILRGYGIPSTEADAQVSVTIPLDAGDTLVAQVFHSSGASRNVTAWMSMYRIAAVDL